MKVMEEAQPGTGGSHPQAAISRAEVIKQQGMVGWADVLDKGR